MIGNSLMDPIKQITKLHEVGMGMCILLGRFKQPGVTADDRDRAAIDQLFKEWDAIWYPPEQPARGTT